VAHVTGKSRDDGPLEGTEFSRRELIRRIAVGSAFAVPVIASFDMSSLGVSSAYANNGNQGPTPPSFSSANTATFTVGVAGAFYITTPGSPSMTLTQTGTLPNGVAFDPDYYNYDNYNDTSGHLTGTPAAGTGDSYPLAFTVNGAVSPPATQNFTLLVNQAAVFTSADALTVDAGQAASFTVTTSGFPGAVISASSLPPGMTLTANQGAGTAALSGTPSVGGVYPLALTAFNGVGSAAVQPFTITVVPSSAFTVSGVKTGKTAAFTFNAKVPGPGTITAALTAPGKAGKRVTIATAKTTISSAGTIAVKTTPNKAGRNLASAKHARSEVLWLAVTFTPTGGTAAVHTVKGLHLK
jgi:hypothetical protein